jgi:H-NS histone family
VVWIYRKIALNQHHRRGDDVELLCDAGEEGWELVSILPNNVAYMKRKIEDEPASAETDHQHQHEPAVGLKPKYRDPRTNETWSGRGRMATWLKRKQDAGEDIEKYRVEE